MPTMIQAGVYSATHHYLEAVKALGTKDPEKVMAKMRETPINDFMTKNGKLRIDGRVVRDMYLLEVKKPEESKDPWDYVKIVETVPGDQAVSPARPGRLPAGQGRRVSGVRFRPLPDLSPQGGRGLACDRKHSSAQRRGLG